MRPEDSQVPRPGNSVDPTAHGAPAGFEELVVRWGPTILKLAYRLTGDLEEARDIRQQALMRTYHSAETFEGRSRFFTWLYRVVVHLCRDGQRRRAVRERAQDTSARNGRAVEVTSPASLAEAGDTAQRVARAVRGLPEREREVLVLRHYHDLSFPEVAAVLDLPATTVKSRLARGLERLRIPLQELEPHE